MDISEMANKKNNGPDFSSPKSSSKIVTSLDAPLSLEVLKDFFGSISGSLLYCLSAIFVAYGIVKVLGPVLSESQALQDAFPCIFTLHVYELALLAVLILVVSRKVVDDAMSIANDTLYGLGAGVWTRNGNRAYRFGRAIQAGRVWTNCYHAYPAHAAFGGYKQSGIGRETHKMMLDHYQQTKNMLVSYSTKALGFF